MVSFDDNLTYILWDYYIDVFYNRTKLDEHMIKSTYIDPYEAKREFINCMRDCGLTELNKIRFIGEYRKYNYIQDILTIMTKTDNNAIQNVLNNIVRFFDVIVSSDRDGIPYIPISRYSLPDGIVRVNDDNWFAIQDSCHVIYSNTCIYRDEDGACFTDWLQNLIVTLGVKHLCNVYGFKIKRKEKDNE